MTVTVPTLALVLPFMVAWIVGYLLESQAEWNRQVDGMLLDNDVTPKRFIRGCARAFLAGCFWPITVTVSIVRRSA